jgi:predicted membrane channel-forming protein YqfA (hemolysin III family)
MATNITFQSYVLGIIVALTFIILMLCDRILAADIPDVMMRIFIEGLILFLITLVFYHILTEKLTENQ